MEKSPRPSRASRLFGLVGRLLDSLLLPEEETEQTADSYQLQWSSADLVSSGWIVVNAERYRRLGLALTQDDRQFLRLLKEDHLTLHNLLGDDSSSPDPDAVTLSDRERLLWLKSGQLPGPLSDSGAEA